MSNSADIQKTRELLGVETIAEAPDAIRALQRQPINLVVSWVPGSPELKAGVKVLNEGRVSFNDITAALRAAEAAMERQLFQRVQQLQAQLQKAQIESEEKKE